MISFQNFSFRYEESKDFTLRGIDMTVQTGEFILLTGRSGCGKTTLIRSLNGLIPHFYPGEIQGDLLMDGHSLLEMKPSELAGQVGTVFQDPRSQFFMTDTTRELAFGCENLGLKYFGLSDYHETIREWYDGYQFGKKAVYCPWDVISYCRNLCADPDAIPEDFWSNTSSNSIVSRFIDKANKQTRDEIENLISGETVIKEIKQELTYNELDKSIENLWSILFTTGYLTQRERIDSRKLRLAIPNREIKELFELQIREWFQEKSSEDVKKLDKLCMAFPDGDAETIEDLFNDYLWNTISIRDTAVKGRKENFYHGVLLGLLSHMENWAVWSNIESGEGYCDILLEVPENRVGVVIEMKYAQEDRMEAACTEALKQIEQRQYAARLKSDGMKNIVNYGIACYRKHCKVKIGKENS